MRPMHHLRKPYPKYQAFHSEITECIRKGYGYVASDPIGFIVLTADEMRREGNIRAAEMLKSAALLVARSQATALAACRRGHIRMKPKKVC